MLRSFIPLTLLLVVSGQCPAPTTTVTVAASATTTISSGTSATISGLASVVAESCAQVYLTTAAPSAPQSTAAVTLRGGTATLAGFFDTVDPVRNFPTPVVAIVYTGVIATASYAFATVLPTGSLSVVPYPNDQNSFNNLRITVQTAATLSIPNGERLEATISGGTAYITGRNNIVFASASGARVEASASSGYGVVGSTGAQAIYTGTAYSLYAYSGAVATLYGQGATAMQIRRNGARGTYVIRGDNMYAQITQTGSLDLSGGSGNRAVLGGGASGTVSGSGNTVEVSSGGLAQLQGGATATVSAAGAASLRGDVTDVQILSGGSAGLDESAIVTADPSAVVTANNPTNSIVTIGAVSTSAILQARYIAPVSMMRRASRPMPTPACGRLSMCPDPLGGYACVDFASSIFNCGGCSWGYQATGVDCTLLTDEGVACVQGKCVARDSD